MPDAPGDINPTTDTKFTLQVRRMDLEAGWIGRVIGGPKNAPNNIAFVVVSLVLIAGVVVSFVLPADRVELEDDPPYRGPHAGISVRQE